MNALQEKERALFEDHIAKGIPYMTDFQKGYLLGVAESMREQNKKQQPAEEFQKAAG